MKKQYDINGNVINREKSTDTVGTIFELLGTLFIIGIVIFGGCFLICILSM